MIETVFHSPDTGFPVLAILAFCTLSAVFAMALVAWHDCRCFEIDLELLGVATVALSPVILLQSGPAGLASATAVGLATGAVTWLVVLWKPGRIGQGDIRLMAFLGFVAGPDHATPVLAALCLFCVLTAAAYSRARGKRLFRSMFPAALPGMGAALLALILRLGGSGGWNADPTLPNEMDMTAQFVIGALIFAVIATGLTLIARRLRSWDR